MRTMTRTIALATAVAEGFLAPRQIAAAAVPTDSEGAVKSWVQLLKVGKFEHSTYGRFDVDAAFLREIAANFEQYPQAVPMDYDHSFLTSGSTRAAGWITQVDIRAGGRELWGEVSWTAAAAQAIRDGEYRFLSPEFTSNWVDETGEGRGPALLAGGITNRPFLEGMPELSLAQDADGDRILLMKPARQGATDQGAQNVDREQMIKAMGLAADATDEQIIAAARARVAVPDGAVVLSATEHKTLTDRAAAGDEAERKANARVKDMHLATWKQTGRLAPADEEMVSIAYDADPAKVIASMDARKPNPAFISKGGNGDDGGDDDDSDKPRPARVHERAVKLMSDRSDLDYATALRQADREIPRDHPALR